MASSHAPDSTAAYQRVGSDPEHGIPVVALRPR